jgi:hypothetical protein
MQDLIADYRKNFGISENNSENLKNYILCREYKDFFDNYGDHVVDGLETLKNFLEEKKTVCEEREEGFQILGTRKV